MLQWLNSLDKQPIFVANRVSEIFELTTVDQWNYIATSDNPADAGTSGPSADALIEKKLPTECKLELTTVDQWNYIATSDNPADAGSSGPSADALIEKKLPTEFKMPENPENEFRHRGEAVLRNT